MPRLVSRFGLIVPALAAMGGCGSAAAQPANVGQAEPAYCATRTIYDAVHAGTMPLVTGCIAAQVARAFQLAGVPLEVAPPDGAPRFIVLPAGGPSVPSLPVTGQSPDQGQSLPRPVPGVASLYAKPAKTAPPLISLETVAPPPPSPVALSLTSDVTAVRPGRTIAFTVAAQGDLSRPVSLTYAISDPAACAPAMGKTGEIVLNPSPGHQTIRYKVCDDGSAATERQVTFSVTPLTDAVTVDRSQVSVSVTAPPQVIATGPSTAPDPYVLPQNVPQQSVPGWLWWAIGGGAAVLVIRRLMRPRPWPPEISASCALDLGTPALRPATDSTLPSASLRIDVGVGRPVSVGRAEETSDG